MNIINQSEHQGLRKLVDNCMRRQQINQLLIDKSNCQSIQEKLREKVSDYNNKAIQYSSTDKWEQSLKYLNLAENVLEEAAIKGYIVDKYLVICILNNLAGCYQNLWKLEMCSNYIEALIYNLNEKNHQQNDQKHKGSQLGIKNISKLALSQYYLQFSAINSQLQLHSGALISARKSLTIIKAELKDWQQIFIKQKSRKRSDYEQMQNKFHIVNTFNDNVSLNSQEIVFQATNFYYSLWQSNILNLKKRNKEIQEFIQTFSLKEIMNLHYLSYTQCKQKIQKPYQISYLLFMRYVFMLSSCYFTISTQLRLLSQKKAKHVQQNPQEIPQFKQSQIYHLFAIIILTLTTNQQSNFMKSLITIFQNHYHKQLTKSSFNKIFNQILFVREEKVPIVGSFELSSIQQGLVSNISKQAKLKISQQKIGRNSQVIFEKPRKVKFKTSSKSKQPKEKSKIKKKYRKKSLMKSASKSPNSKIVNQKSSILKKSQINKKSLPSKETLTSNTHIPSFKYLMKNNSKIGNNFMKNQAAKKDKTRSKSKKLSPALINQYFLPKKSGEKRHKKTSLSSKHSEQYLRIVSAGRLPLNSTLQLKQKVVGVSSKQKQKKKKVKKMLVQHYL